MPNFKKKHSNKINISKSAASGNVKEILSSVSNTKLKGYVKRKAQKLSAQKEAASKYSEYSRKNRAKDHLRDANDPKPFIEKAADFRKKVLLFIKSHKTPKDKRASRQIKPKYILLILAVVCVALIIASGVSEKVRKPFKDAASVFVVPAQKGVNSIGMWLSDIIKTNKSISELQDENQKLREQVDQLTLEMSALRQNDAELSRLNELLSLKDTYSNYDMIGAHIIAKGPSKWFSTFTIDVGTRDGVTKDMNVLASGGLAGIVIDAGENFSTVRAIIDDESSVSAQFEDNSELCMINGSLSLMEDNMLEFTNVGADVFIAANSAVVTSHVSSKYLPGLLIGYVSDYYLDANDLTQSGHIKPVVDFSGLEEVLVIRTLKETAD